MVLAIVSIIAGLLATAVLRSRDRAHLFACQSNLRQLYVAVSMYGQDYPAGALPQVQYGVGDPLAKWVRAMLPYYAGKEILTCPLWDSRSTGITMSYVLNDSFAHGASLHDAVDPSTTILLAERRPGYTHLDYHWQPGGLALQDSIDTGRHSGVSNYLFVDGHVEAMPFDYTLQPINMHNPGHYR